MLAQKTPFFLALTQVCYWALKMGFPNAITHLIKVSYGKREFNNIHQGYFVIIISVSYTHLTLPTNPRV